MGLDSEFLARQLFPNGVEMFTRQRPSFLLEVSYLCGHGPNVGWRLVGLVKNIDVNS